MLEAGIARLKDDERLISEFDEQYLKELEDADREIAAGEVLDWKQVSAELRREFSASEIYTVALYSNHTEDVPRSGVIRGRNVREMPVAL